VGEGPSAVTEEKEGRSVSVLAPGKGKALPSPDPTTPSENERPRLAGVPFLRIRRFIARWIGPAVVVAAGLGIWTLIAVTVFSSRAYVLPPPWSVAAAVGRNAGLILSATRHTFTEAILGYLLAIGIGVAAAIVMSQSAILERSLYPFAILLQTVPILAVVPIIVLWFKFGLLSLVVISFIIAVFPIINNTLAGLKRIDPTIIELLSFYGASRFQRFYKVQFPNAIPNMINGFQTSAGLSVIGAMIGEFVIGGGGFHGGLGIQILFSQEQFETSLMFGEAIAATLLSLLFFGVVSLMGSLVTRKWR